MLGLFIVFAIFASVVPAVGAYKAPETTYSARWCDQHHGQTEVRQHGGTRADFVTGTHTIEVERASKWYQAIGQSLWYTFQTNKSAGILMIIGCGDRKYL